MFQKSIRVSSCAIALGLLGCAASKPVKTVHTPNFPKFTSTMGSTQSVLSDISIALINPSYGTTSTGGEEHEWAKMFRASLAKEIEQLIVNRGFKVVGPFATVDEMTFPQKKQSDLLLMPIINVILNYPQAQTVTKTDWGSALAGGSGTKEIQIWNGPCNSQGFINFELWEPLSMQKMWAKRVDIEPTQVDCSAKNYEAFVAAYNAALAQLLETSYKTALSKADAYFAREEIELVTKQSQELRTKKVY
ncbi:MAG: hypothetical protein ACREOI_09170 [bacterium]